MMLELAEHYDEGPTQIGEIARRQDISVKYLEQLIIPLKKNDLIKSVRGPKGGHLLAKPPDKISIGEIVKVLEGSICLSDCIENPASCDMFDSCLTRHLWERATNAMFNELDSITLDEMINGRKNLRD
jgi:Rrf2 family protein